MGDELRAADAYGAKTSGTIAGARYLARLSEMRAAAGDSAVDQVALDAQLRALLGDNVAQGLPLVSASELKDYEVYARMIARAVERHPLGVLLREFGALAFFWRDRGLSYPWLRRIGSVIFGIPEDVMDHALLTNLDYAHANHTGFSPTAHAHAPGDVTGTAVVTADARLSDARTPTAHSHAPGDVTGTAVVTADARLSDARTPTAHTQDVTTILRFGSGFTFPGSPGIGDRYYREDRNILYFWDGAHWVSDQIYHKTLAPKSSMPASANDDYGAAPIQPYNTDVQFVAMDWMIYLTTTQSGSVYWTVTLYSQPSNTSLDSWTTSTLAKNAWQGGRRSLVNLKGTSDFGVTVYCNKTGAPGAIQIYCVVQFRLIG